MLPGAEVGAGVRVGVGGSAGIAGTVPKGRRAGAGDVGCALGPASSLCKACFSGPLFSASPVSRLVEFYRLVRKKNVGSSRRGAVVNESD